MQTCAIAVEFSRCNNSESWQASPTRAATKSSLENLVSKALSKDKLLCDEPPASSSGSPGGVILGGVGECGGVAPVAVRSLGALELDAAAHGGIGPRGVRGRSLPLARALWSSGCS